MYLSIQNHSDTSDDTASLGPDVQSIIHNVPCRAIIFQRILMHTTRCLFSFQMYNFALVIFRMSAAWHHLLYKLIHLSHSALLTCLHFLLLSDFPQLQDKLHIFFPVTDDSVQQLLDKREGAVMPSLSDPCLLTAAAKSPHSCREAAWPSQRSFSGNTHCNPFLLTYFTFSARRW